MKTLRLTLVATLVAVVALLLLWSFAKPVRLLIPELNGMYCQGAVCTDDPNRLKEVSALYAEAFDSLSVYGARLDRQPTFVYCTTEASYRSFGGGNERAISYPYLGTLIGPASWQDYITRHELVHWVQFRKLGALTTMQSPEWFREGMAYALSGAPESDIPAHYLPMIARYLDWSDGKTWPQIMRDLKNL